MAPSTSFASILLALAAGLAIAPAATLAKDAAIVGRGADITAVCGKKPTTVALVDGVGSGVWRRTTRAAFEEEARRCPNVGKLLYAEADNDRQKYNNAINAMVAQGADVVVAFADFGDAGLPAYRKATHDGVTVVPYFSKLGGTVGKDYAANVYFDHAMVGPVWADWIAKTVKSGGLVFLGGVAGTTVSKQYFDGLKAAMKKYPALHWLEDDYVVTNWNPSDAQRAVAGLIAKHKKIDGIIADGGVATLAAVKVFEQAGLPVPPQATIASFNDLNCRYLAARKSGTPWKYLSLDGTNRIAGFALRRAMAIRQGLALDESESVMAYTYADSEAGIDPHCDPAAPLDADFSSGLSADKLEKIFKR